MNLKQAILETLAYSDVFDHPLTLGELHKFLVASAPQDEIEKCAAGMDTVACKDGYYFLAHRTEILDIRQTREVHSQKAFKRAVFYGRILGRLPFIRMAALTGSLAMLNLSKNSDMDYLIVARHGRVWTARAFALLLDRIARLFGDVICPNVIVSERTLEWNTRNIYAAREFAQMIPISGMDVYRRLIEVNAWVTDFLPNAFPSVDRFETGSNPNRRNLFEFFFNGKLGDRFEQWEMNRKIARFKKQQGYGAETNFSADICQGNFDHHGLWALKALEDRLIGLQVEK